MAHLSNLGIAMWKYALTGRQSDIFVYLTDTGFAVNWVCQAIITDECKARMYVAAEPQEYMVCVVII